MDKTPKSEIRKNLTQPVANVQDETRLEPGHADFPAEPLKIGSIIKNRFILESELGRGGMGVVYKVRDLRKEEAKDRNPFIALKILSEDFKSNPVSFIALQRETRKSQDLAHPNIVTVYDFDRDGDHVYMTMECLDGKPLSELLKNNFIKDKPLNERWAIIKQIGVALVYAHEKKIIHLDLKPGNIFIKNDGAVKVLDFGIARVAINTDQTQTSADATVFDAGSLGALTPCYASCEMLENQQPDFRDDVFSLACVAYEILSGHHPFNKIPATQARFNKMTVGRIDEITNKQQKALIRALQFNRQDRTVSVNQFLRETQLLDAKNKSGYFGQWFAAAIISGLAVAAIYQTVLLRGNNILQQPVIVDKDLPLVDDISPQKKLSEKQQQKIARILEAAEMHALIGRLIEPRGANAMDGYNQVLLIDPQNKTAQKGLQEIARYYEQQAFDLWIKGDRRNSILNMEKGLLAVPDDKELLLLKEKLGSSRQ